MIDGECGWDGGDRMLRKAFLNAKLSVRTLSVPPAQDKQKSYLS